MASPQKGQPLKFARLPDAFNIPQLKERRISAVFEDKDSVFWIACESGLTGVSVADKVSSLVIYSVPFIPFFAAAGTSLPPSGFQPTAN